MNTEIKVDNPNVNIVIDDDGIPCIVLPPILPPRFVEFHVVQFQPPKPKDFTELQKEKEDDNFQKILDELEKLFKGLL